MDADYFMRVYRIYWVHWGYEQNRLRRREDGIRMLTRRMRLRLVPETTSCPWRLQIRLLFVIRALLGIRPNGRNDCLEWMPIRRTDGRFVHKEPRTVQSRLFCTFYNPITFRLDTPTAKNIEALDLVPPAAHR